MSLQPNIKVNQPLQNKKSDYAPLAVGAIVASGIGAGFVGYSRDMSVDHLKDTFIKAAKQNLKEEAEYEVIGFKEEIKKALAEGNKANAEYCINKSKEICKDKWRTHQANELFIDIKRDSKNSHKKFLKTIDQKLDYFKIIKPMKCGPDLGNCCHSKHFYNMPIDIGIKHYENFKNSVEKFVGENLTKYKLQKAGVYGGITTAVVATAAYLFRPKHNEKQDKSAEKTAKPSLQNENKANIDKKLQEKLSQDYLLYFIAQQQLNNID